jgi:PIN domain
MEWVPFSSRLRDELDTLAAVADQLLDLSGIEYRGHRNQGRDYVIIAPDWAWAAPTDDLRRLQMKVVPRFEAWFERFRLLFRDAPEELRQQGDDLHGQIREWLARDGTAWSGWDVPKTIPEAKHGLAERFARLAGLIDVVAPATFEGGTIAVPDSSALLDNPDFERYPDALGIVQLDMYLVPGVLSELDALKDQGRTPEVRLKARAAGLAIKRVRQHGSLLTGVEVAAGLRIFSRPTEPRFDGLPGALDPASPDDRILASAFELQREHPTSAVVLVTGDINLQTKAELAQLPFAEPPPRDGASA